MTLTPARIRLVQLAQQGAVISEEVAQQPPVSGSVTAAGASASTVYTSHRVSAPATQTLSWSAWQQVTPSSTSVANPSAASRCVAATTSLVELTSTPR